MTEGSLEELLLNGSAGIQEMEAESRKHQQKSREERAMCRELSVRAQRESFGAGEVV